MLGPYLTTLREARGLTVPDIVARLDVPRATAYSWERADGRPEPENLQRFLDLVEATDDERLEAWRLRALPRAVAEDEEAA